MTVSDPGGRYVISCEQLAELSLDSLQNYGLDEAEFGPDVPLLPPPTLNFNVSHGSQKSLLITKRSMTPGELALLYTAACAGRTKYPATSGMPWHEATGIPNILRGSWLNPSTRSVALTTSLPKFSVFGR